ncbi:MAG: RNA methyltransferase [Opitutales bacterium]|nr:RNA methyltransferase [Opitutales bacterium]
MARASKEFLYGLNPAFEALIAGRRRFHGAYINAATAGSGRLRKLTERIEAGGIPVEWSDKGRLQQLCGSREHQGVVLRTSLYPYTPHDDLLTAGRVLLLDNVEDPHNVGAILRSAEVFGFSEVLLPLKGVPEIYPSVAKVSAGAVEHMRIARDCTANRYAMQALERGYHIAALDAKGAVELREFAARPPDKLLLVIGGEDRGVGQYILNQAHTTLRLDQAGRVNSLNASVAAGIAMFALAR